MRHDPASPLCGWLTRRLFAIALGAAFGLAVVAAPGCASNPEPAQGGMIDAAAAEQPIVYIRGKAIEHGTGRVIANPPPRPRTMEDELLDETRRKSDVTIWAAVAGPEGKVVWVPVRRNSAAR